VNYLSNHDKTSQQPLLTTWLDFGGPRSRSQQAVKVVKASTLTLGCPSSVLSLLVPAMSMPLFLYYLLFIISFIILLVIIVNLTDGCCVQLLHNTALQHVRHNRSCIEPCVRQLMISLESLRVCLNVNTCSIFSTMSHKCFR